MKKLLIILALIVLIISIAACDDTETTTETAVSTTETVTFENPGSHTIEVPIYSIYDLNEYTELLKTIDLPDDFISYENIAFLGDFVRFSYYDNDLTEYWYVVKNGEQKLSLRVDPKEKYGDPVNSDTIKPISNVKQDLLQTSGGFNVKIGSSWYCFTDVLAHVKFVTDDHMYYLSGFDKNKLVEEGSIIERLVHLDTTEAAMDEIKARLTLTKE